MSRDAAGIESDPDLSDGPNEVIIADRYRILPGSPLPEMETPGVTAFVARDLKNPNEMAFARICDPTIFPRVEVMVQLKHLKEANMILPEEWGPVYWPPARRRCFAIVFKRPESGPVMPSLKARIPKLEVETIVRSFLNPTLATLNLFERRKITHRAIRPTNVFAAGDTSMMKLGDCVSVPPSWGQSTIFETIESAMTPPNGRGRGTIGDDLYALGATMLFLGMGHCPVADLSEQELLAAKIEQGSFTALMGGGVAPGGLREPIRGMLSDDPLDRWTLDDLHQWATGSLRRSARPLRDYKADRPFKFGNREFRNTRSLAAAFGDNWREAVKTVRSKPFDTWLQRGVSDVALVESVSDVIEAAGGENESADAKLISRICAQFDPEGPLRFKGLTVMPDGMGYALSHAIEQKDAGTLALITELIQKGIAGEWFDYQIEAGRADLGLESKAFKKLQQFVRHAGPGYGIERVLYELNPFLPCRSDMLAGAYVYSLRDLLPALDRVAAEKGGLPMLIDRHIAAFIASRVSGGIDSQLGALEHTTGASPGAKIGMTGLLARVQSEYPNQRVPHLTAWLVAELEPALSRYNSQSLRKRIREKMEEVSTSGNLLELYQMLSNKNIAKRDEKGLKSAKKEYTEATREIVRLESVEFQKEARRTGWRIASGISALIGVLTTITVLGT